MNILLNDKELEVKSVSCGLNGVAGYSYDNIAINVYVSLTKECNARCPFCTFRGIKEEFDFDKFRYSLKKILEVIPINKLSFTGGEPTLELETMIKCLEEVKRVSNDTFTIVNTNGTRLKDLECIDTLDNIAMSRHTISDKDNQEIFGGALVPTLEDIMSFKEKDKLHLSCNLIRGHIDSQERVLEYLEEVSIVGVKDVGFVSLMPVNEYAKERGIDFSDIPFIFSERFITNKEYCYKKEGNVACKCRNYLYLTKENKVVTVYSRYYVDRDCNDNAFVFIENKLRQGFSGPIII